MKSESKNIYNNRKTLLFCSFELSIKQNNPTKRYSTKIWSSTTLFNIDDNNNNNNSEQIVILEW